MGAIQDLSNRSPSLSSRNLLKTRGRFGNALYLNGSFPKLNSLGEDFNWQNLGHLTPCGSINSELEGGTRLLTRPEKWSSVLFHKSEKVMIMCSLHLFESTWVESKAQCVCTWSEFLPGQVSNPENQCQDLLAKTVERT